MSGKYLTSHSSCQWVYKLTIVYLPHNSGDISSLVMSWLYCLAVTVYTEVMTEDDIVSIV